MFEAILWIFYRSSNLLHSRSYLTLFIFRNGIKSQLKTLHLKYLESEQGVLLRYTNIKFKERAARIVSISPELHFDISCTVTVFRPKMGAILEGTVVKIGPGYVNCLVFGYFTAVVYDRFTNPVEVGSVIRFKLAFYQVTVHNDFILKGSPVTWCFQRLWEFFLIYYIFA